MPKLYKDALEIDTDLPAEIVALKSQGFSPTKLAKVAEPAADETSRAEAVKPAPKSTK